MHEHRAMRTISVLLLVAMIGLPVFAIAGPKQSDAARSAKQGAKQAAKQAKEVAKVAAKKERAAGGKSNQAAKAAKQARLTTRVQQAIGNREARFAGAHSRISEKTTKLESIASTLEQAGADVSGVRSSVDSVRAKLAEAKVEEEAASGLMRGVPLATNRRAAFAAAKAQARTARETLNEARVELRNAILALRSIANGLKSR